jgi:SAM-dependent methyltransferase
MMTEDWEQRIYAAYVSNSNLTAKPNPDLLFGPRQYYIKKVISQHFPGEKSIKILELACGPAPFLYFLKQLGYTNLKGIDISPEQVSLAHAIGLEKEVVQGDMLNFLSESFDEVYGMIVLFDVLEHFRTSDQFDIMDKIYSKLIPGGICIIHVPNAGGNGGIRALYSDITHKSAFTNRSMYQLLHVTGFSDIECFEDKPIAHNLFSFFRRIIWDWVTFFQMILISAETGALYRKRFIFSPNMLVVAKKR